MDLDTTFKAVNLEPKGAASPNNPMKAFTRAEWLECIVRLARAKFGHLASPQLAPAVDALVVL